MVIRTQETYTGNPIGCAAALASLDLFEKDRVLEAMPEKIRFFADALRTINSLRHVSDVRQWGTMVGIELVEDVASRKSYAPAKRFGKQVMLAARRRGVILRPLGDVVILNPPLSSSTEELANLAFVTAKAIDEASLHMEKS
jgi:adenosylmethionine---8-amino-7-oxononanoate aminotransferase